MRLAMIRVCIPLGKIVVSLVSPCCPTIPAPTREHFEERAGGARLDDAVCFVGLSAVLALHSGEEVDLSSAGRKSSCVFAANTEQNQLSDVPKVKADSPPVWATVFSDFVPDEV